MTGMLCVKSVIGAEHAVPMVQGMICVKSVIGAEHAFPMVQGTVSVLTPCASTRLLRQLTVLGIGIRCVCAIVT
jgi:hypothetical protein